MDQRDNKRRQHKKKFGKFGGGRAGEPRPAGKAAAAGPKVATAWQRDAEWYDQIIGDEGGEYHRNVVLPGAMRLLGVQAGQHVLDVACGQGVLCRLLHKAGAEVIGVDASPKLIELARQRSDPAITYLVGDARDPSRLPAGHFHAAACILAAQNINPLAPAFEGVARCLAEGGRFVIVMMHPCFRGPKYTAWGWEGNDTQFRRVDRYLLPRKEPIVTHPGASPDKYTWTFHRPIQGYVKPLARAGLLVDAIEEWPSHKTSEPGPRAKAENSARKEIPLFLALRAVKMPGYSTPKTTDDLSEVSG
ncbi:MAG: class I SAM-dependent methyltransferase [Planctomycetes bacterium]|nr:class I SAM-dependent methyltransferase [Planctomycetota bacterium]